MLVSKERKQREIKEIAIYNHPENLKLILDKLTWRILQLLGEKEMYPMEIAKKLGIHEQKVYYHIRKLIKANAVKKVKDFRDKHNLTYPMLVGNKKIARAYAIRGIPATYILDKNHIIVKRYVGALASLEDIISLQIEEHL